MRVLFVLLEMAMWAARKGEDGSITYIAVSSLRWTASREWDLSRRRKYAQKSLQMVWASCCWRILPKCCWILITFNLYPEQRRPGNQVRHDSKRSSGETEVCPRLKWKLVCADDGAVWIDIIRSGAKGECPDYKVWCKISFFLVLASVKYEQVAPMLLIGGTE